MSNPVAKPGKAKAQIKASAFGALRSATGEDTQGDALRIPLGDIDEDPNQPRKHFDADELASMAETIKTKGVIQAIVVRPAVEGRYMLVAGARRFRASKLAGVADIPAIVRKVEDDDFAAQVIENTQRSNLTNSEIADAVARFVAEGRTNKEIAAICALKEWQMTAYRKVADFPAELRARLDTADMRALYDLFRQWQKTPDEVIAALPPEDVALSITDARRIVGTLTGKVEGFANYQPKPKDEQPSPASEAAPAPAPVEVAPPAPAPVEAADPAPVPAPVAEREAGDDKAPQTAPEAPEDAEPALHSAKPAPAPAVAPAPVFGASEQDEQDDSPALPPVFIVRVADGSEGRLIVDQKAETPGWALVAFGSIVEDIDPAEITFLRIE